MGQQLDTKQLVFGLVYQNAAPRAKSAIYGYLVCICRVSRVHTSVTV